MSVDSSENSEVGVEMPVTKRRTVDRRSAIDRVTSKPRHWRPAEDESLRRAVQKLGEKNWKAIAKHVEGRNHTQCFQRWYKVLCPGLKKGKWSPEEDELLKKLATEQLEACDKDNLPRKLNWGVVCKHIIGRTAKQCRERWVNNLNPEIKKGRWTREEDNLILKLNEQYPKKWALIAKHLQGRTENSVKIRYHTLVRIGNLEDEPDDASVKGQKRKRPFDAKESEKPEKKELKATGQLPEGLAADMAKAYQYPVRPFAPQPGYFIPQGYMPGFDYTGNAFNGKLMQPMMPNFAPMPDAQVAPQFAGGQLLGPNPGMNYGMLPPQLQGQMYLNQGMQFVSQFPVV